jgi:pimeloyl-ACP methyl ester carboxylesterase
VVAHEPIVGPLGGDLHTRLAGRINRLLVRADRPGETSLFMSELVGERRWNALRQDWRHNVERYGAATRHEASLFAGFALTEVDLATLARAALVATVGAESPGPRQELAAALAARGIATGVIADATHLPLLEAPAAFTAVIDGARHP